MNIVTAKREPETVPLSHLEPGNAFRRIVPNAPVWLRGEYHDKRHIGSTYTPTGMFCLDDPDVRVIPVRVLLVEKGADISEVQAALEKL